MPDTPTNQNLQSAAYSPQPQQHPPQDSKRILFRILDKRMVIPLLVLILLILAAIIITYFVRSTTSETVKNQVRELPAVTITALIPQPEEIRRQEVERVSAGCPGISNISGYVSRDACLFNHAKEYLWYEFCDKMTKSKGQDSVDACYEYVSIIRGNSDYCRYIVNIAGEYSRDSCFIGVANSTNDPTICTQVVMVTGKKSQTECAEIFKITEEEFLELYGPSAEMKTPPP